ITDSDEPRKRKITDSDSQESKKIADSDEPRKTRKRKITDSDSQESKKIADSDEPRKRKITDSDSDEPRKKKSRKITDSDSLEQPRKTKKTKMSKKIASDSDSLSNTLPQDPNIPSCHDIPDNPPDNTTPKSVIWPQNSPVPYSALCEMFALAESTTKRLEITSYCSKFFTAVIALTPNDLTSCIYLTINRLAPAYQGVELGIGESLLIKAISGSTGRSVPQVKSDYAKIGDLGIIAKDSRMNQPTLSTPKSLTVQTVLNDLKEIATATGHSSQTRKVAIIKKLLSSCKGQEAKYLIRSLEGKLRIHLAEKTVLSALAQAAVASTPTDISKAEHNKTEHIKTEHNKAERISKAERIIKSVYNELPSYDIVVEQLLTNGIEKLQETCKLTPGIPLKPMLARPTKAISQVLDRFESQKFTCEYKYDGERAQVHLLPSGDAKIYSRNSENTSNKYPDIINNLASFTKDSTTSFVLDCECVAWDVENKQLLPFQVLSTRKRKDVKLEDVKVKVCLFAFDLLYLNGESLLQRPLEYRREKMFDAFIPVQGVFEFARFADCTTIDEIQTFLDKSVQDKCEGLLVKMLQGEASYYEPSRRSSNWLKLKKDYLAGIGDSLDLVVLGAFFGRGKRTSMYGAFLLGCFDPDREEYQSICKIGTGFTESDLETLYTKLSQHVISHPKSYYSHPTDGLNKPDVWFDVTAHKLVWEVLSADLSLSPVYKAGIGLVDENKGISLRFPRYIRTREDKGPEQATTSSQIADMFRQQVQKGSLANGPSVDDDFEY
ncbi:DNA ligase 1, partial [Neolecta irregularis DAH-3]